MKSLEGLVDDAIETVDAGFYNNEDIFSESLLHSVAFSGSRSLIQRIKDNKNISLICELKFASPTAGVISDKHDRVSEIARQMESGGAAGLSVLTEPKNFRGSLFNLIAARRATSLPVIMKDIIVAKEQIVAAAKIGATAILLIEEVFSGGRTKENLTLPEAISLAKKLGLEVIVETHTRNRLDLVANSKCDILGINNRDLKTFDTKIRTTLTLLKEISDLGDVKLVMSESGFEKPDDIAELIDDLNFHHCRIPDAFLIGTAIMKSSAIEKRVRGFVEVLNSQ